MESTNELIQRFLASPSIAVVGASSRKQTVANVVYAKLKNSGRTVYAVGRSGGTINGDPCYPDLASLPAPVSAVFVSVRPENIIEIAGQCHDRQVAVLWLHHAGGTVHAANSPTALVVERCRSLGLPVIAGACPMMFIPGADFGHRAMKWFLGITGQLR